MAESVILVTIGRYDDAGLNPIALDISTEDMDRGGA